MQNLIPLAHNVSRAYEIAANGKFKVKLIGGKKYDGTYISQEDVDLIRNFYGFEVVDSNADMYVEIAFGPDDIISTLFGSVRCETLEDVKSRIMDFSISDMLVSDGLSEACYSLFKTAIQRLDLSFCDCVRIINVSKVIAKMAGCKEQKPEHIAEAIQYHSLPKEEK